MKAKLLVGAAACAMALQALSAVTADEAKQLGTTLTPVGAIAAGNKEGTIPAWDANVGRSIPVPAGYSAGKTMWIDPFPGDKPRLVITAKNMAEHADKLTDNTKELLKRFPDTMRLDVYPTRRTLVNPKAYEEGTRVNATRCRTVEGGLGVEDCWGGMPFPIPKNGLEQMWNLHLSYKPNGKTQTTQFVVDSTGSMTITGRSESYSTYPLQDMDANKPGDNSLPFRLSQSVTLEPARVAGDGTAALVFANPIKYPNKGFSYQQGQRRVRVSPTVEYDFPIATAGGTFFYDEVFLFSGKMDKFDFKLVGTKEVFIPYNAYKFAAEGDIDKLMSKAANNRHWEPSMLRWELHRVRVVEATLKPGQRHAYSKRVFYLDEDHPGAGMVDTWDQAGKPYRMMLSLSYMPYAPRLPYTGELMSIDFTTGIWANLSHFAGNKMVPDWGTDAKPHPGWPASFYSPEGIARLHSR